MHPIVQVRVLETQPNGVLVRILEGRHENKVGLIRRRELSWDQRVSCIPAMPKKDETLTAKIIRDRQGARYVYLSLRELSDPWKKNKGKYQLRQTADLVQRFQA